MQEKIKVGYCVAYDWALLRYAIPRIYDFADTICLSIDRNRRSWTGKAFSWDEEGFGAMIRELDPQGKITLYEDDFSIPDLSPMENEVRQRNMIAGFLGKGGWHVQFDTDEFFLDFESFVRYLRAFKSNRKVNVCCPMINLYKQTNAGMLWIKPETFSQIEFFPIATRHPEYHYGRRNGHFNILTEYPILHQSWARSEQEIWEKLSNWGHAKDFDVRAYFEKWKNADEHSYKTYRNFHHLHPETWPGLALKSGGSIDSLFDDGEGSFRMPIRKGDLRKANSIWWSRFRELGRRLKISS